MTRKSYMRRLICSKMLTKGLSLFMIFLIITGALAGCGGKSSSYGVSPENPAKLTFWLSGSDRRNDAFVTMVDEFNTTLGTEKGIQIETVTYSSDNKLSKAYKELLKAKENTDLPNMIAVSESSDLLYDEFISFADLNGLIEKDTRDMIFENLITAGTYGKDSELRLLPIVKDTTVFAVNLDRWNSFKTKEDHHLNELGTWEGLNSVGSNFFKEMDGLSLYGIDDVSEYVFVGSRQLGMSFLTMEDRKPVIRTEGGVMRTLWDNYYTASLHGANYFMKSDRLTDMNEGNITIASMKSSETAALSDFNATEGDAATSGDALLKGEYQIIPYPQFKGQDKICPVDDTGIAVIKRDETSDKACAIFLEWILEEENNMKLACLSGSLPSNKNAATTQYFEEYHNKNSYGMTDMEVGTMRIILEMAEEADVYTAPMCDIYPELKTYVGKSLAAETINDRNAVDDSTYLGIKRYDAVLDYSTDEHFTGWLNEFKNGLPK